jgi:hypothetical protein
MICARCSATRDPAGSQARSSVVSRSSAQRSTDAWSEASRTWTIGGKASKSKFCRLSCEREPASHKKDPVHPASAEPIEIAPMFNSTGASDILQSVGATFAPTDLIQGKRSRNSLEKLSPESWRSRLELRSLYAKKDFSASGRRRDLFGGFRSVTYDPEHQPQRCMEQRLDKGASSRSALCRMRLGSIMYSPRHPSTIYAQSSRCPRHARQ